MALLMKKAILDDVILMHTTRALAAGDLSEEGGVRRRHGISGWPEAGRGRRGASSGRGGSDYMVDAILSCQQPATTATGGITVTALVTHLSERSGGASHVPNLGFRNQCCMYSTVAPFSD